MLITEYNHHTVPKNQKQQIITPHTCRIYVLNSRILEVGDRMGQIKKSRQKKYISKRYQNNFAETVVSRVRTWIEKLSESLTQVSSSIQQPIPKRQPTLPPFSPSNYTFHNLPAFPIESLFPCIIFFVNPL